MRDAILAVSGDLNRAAGGPPVMISARSDGMVTVANDRLADHAAERYRRSVYLTTRRAYNLSLLTVFDQPLVATNCLRAHASAVPLQSLFMLNDAFLAEQAEHLARRVESLPAASPERADRARRFGSCWRSPNADETATCRGSASRRQVEPRPARCHDQRAAAIRRSSSFV